MIKIAVLDDDSIQLNQIRQMIDAYIDENSISYLHVQYFTSGKALLNARYEHGPFDIYLMDIVMPEINGIDIGLQLRSEDDQGFVIYLTSESDFALDSYNVRAYHYLLKPIEKQQLFDVLHLVLDEINHQIQHIVEVKTPTESLMISKREINYVELSHRRLHYHLSNGSVIVSVSLHDSFKNAAKSLLESSGFVQCGASYIVNLHLIKSISKTEISFINTETLQLPKANIPALKTIWLDYWFNMN